MTRQNLSKTYMYSVILAGITCAVFAIKQIELPKLDLYFVFLAFFTIALGSRITVQIPRFKSHIAVSDVFIFLVFLMYGGPPAILLAAVEAFCSSWRFCNKTITVVFNAGQMAISTTAVALAVNSISYILGGELHPDFAGNFIIELSVMALTQFGVNSGLASLYSAFKNEQPLWETWKTYYLWTSITYFVGSIGAGTLFLLINRIGFGVLFATIPVMVFVYLTYRMYLKNVEMSISQAEQAKDYAERLENQSIALTESEQRFRSAFTYAPIGIALVDADGKWLKVNNALIEILGYSEQEFHRTDFQSFLHPDDLGQSLIQFHQIVSGKSVTCQAEQRYLHKDGRTVWIFWSGSAASDSKESHKNLIFQMQDITDRKKAEASLEYKATHDVLTGLPNRALFMSQLSDALSVKASNQYHRICVLFIDLDRFKIVNDSLGHLVGDLLLVGIAARLKECLRPSDLVARLGGDEFVILVEGNYGQAEVVRIAERINEQFAIPFNLNTHEIYSSASIGILQVSDIHLSADEVMRDADIAMYQAKRSGKSRYEVFNPQMYEAIKQTHELENDLRRAIEKNEIEVFYQPIYSLETEELEGFEALARWNHPKHGFIPTDKFIPLAEEIGLINVLGEFVLFNACNQGKIWHQMFSNIEPFSISVNLSCKQFSQSNLVQVVRDNLTKTGFSAKLLKLEITESVFLEHKEKAIEMLYELCSLGIEIYIDDFGTGYSNLSCLTQLPVSTLKIDRSFVGLMDGSKRNLDIVDIIMMLAKNIGMKVIAEGVENEDQLNRLRELGCESAQGYFFAKPMSVVKTNEFLLQTLSYPNQRIPSDTVRSAEVLQ
jgi:diguanylate cyclase (GGDEF)-like protein/PAS domain S-box-containing protein